MAGRQAARYGGKRRVKRQHRLCLDDNRIDKRRPETRPTRFHARFHDGAHAGFHVSALESSLSRRLAAYNASPVDTGRPMVGRTSSAR
jgi:hypothetical protein